MTEPKTSYDWPEMITAALARVYDVASETPLQVAPAISESLGNTILLKREDLQPVFSFKLRGAYNKISSLDDAQAAAGVICSSAGNHAQGVALAASMRQVPAVIVMPVTTPAIKINAVQRYPVEVILHGDNYDAAQAAAHKIAADRNLTFIHPFDDPLVIAGQATIGVEIDQQLQEMAHTADAIFIPIGGGGLAAGIAAAIKDLQPNIRLIGVEPEQAASMKAAFAAGGPVTLPRVGNFADGVAVRRVGDLNYELCKTWLDDIITVGTDETCAAIRDIYEQTRTMVEPAGALALAGIKAYVRAENITGQTLIAINCGANLNFDRLRHIAERAAIGERREALFAATIDETPGSFRRFCTTLGKRSITEFNYRYTDTGPARVFVGVELRQGIDEQKKIAEDIRAAGYTVEDLSDNEVAKLHIRHLIGGRAAGLDNERLYRFQFPERPGALEDFLDAVGERWNISLFHYRNHGSDYGRVLAGIQIASSDQAALHQHLDTLSFDYWDETDNMAFRLFLT